MFQIVTYKQNLEFSHCFGTIEDFLAPTDMKIRRVRSGINFLSDFIGFKRFSGVFMKQYQKYI